MMSKFKSADYYPPRRRRDNEPLLPSYHQNQSHELVTHRSHRTLLLAVLTLLLIIAVCIVFICGLLIVDSYSAYINWKNSAADRHHSDSPHINVNNFSHINYTSLFAEITRDYPQDIAAAVNRRISLINCVHAPRVRITDYVGSGWTKAVYRAKLDDGTPVAVKTVSTVSNDMTKCIAQGNTAYNCYERSVRKFLQEVWLLLTFQHPNIVKMIGVCIPKDPSTSQHSLSSIVELGETVDLIQLLQMPWDDRLRIFHDLTNLLTFLSQTLFGSMVLNDFRRQQFVLIDGQLKLTDLDDLNASQKPCKYHGQCTIHVRGSADPEHPQQTKRLIITKPDGYCNIIVTVFPSTSDARLTDVNNNIAQKAGMFYTLLMRGRCVAGFCDRWNERANLHRNYIQFGSFLLSHGHPDRVGQLIQTYKQYSLKGSLSLTWLQKITNKIIEIYKYGQHISPTSLQQPSTGYTILNDTDASPADSLWCAQRYGCRMTVFDIKEARDACSATNDCYGFVLGKEKSWLNQSIVYLKTKSSRHRHHIGHTLFVKTSANESREH